MAQDKPEYEVNEEFNIMATQLVEKYVDKFSNVEIGRVRCVNLMNKPRKEKEGSSERIWKINAVKMPMAMDSPFLWYVVLHVQDWEDLSEKHRLALVADVLHGLPNEIDNQGKVTPCDTKGYHSIFKTIGIDYLDDPDIPHLINDDVRWK